MRSMIVDDDEMGRMMLATLLEEYGPCDQAENGQEALEKFDRAAAEGNPYDLICLDIVMPVMDGSEALRQLRERDRLQRKRTRVFMISACNSPQDIEDAFFEGDCDDYVVKPFRRDAVTHMLTRYQLI